MWQRGYGSQLYALKLCLGGATTDLAPQQHRLRRHRVPNDDGARSYDVRAVMHPNGRSVCVSLSPRVSCTKGILSWVGHSRSIASRLTGDSIQHMRDRYCLTGK